MRFSTVCRILGILLMIFSFTMLPPIAVSIYYDDHQFFAFFDAFLLTLAVGIAIWFPVRNKKKELRVRDGFIVTALFWLVLSLSGSIPLYFSDQPDLRFVDAYFESLSGLTTTGATVITGLDTLPKSILWYRQQLQWFGGMGLIVLAVAILPMLGIGGMQLYRTEIPGPVKDTKLTPRITETAKALWYIYLGLTVACALAYWIAGMSVFDAICHSFSTIAIGGFSTHDTSIGYFDSVAVEMIAVFFMFAAGVNFALHFAAWRRNSWRTYFQDPEFKFYGSLMLLVACGTIGVLYFTGTYGFAESFTTGLFQVVTIATTTGYATADFSSWPFVLPFLLFLIAFVGGCAGSTGGGMKAIRVLLIYKQGLREVKRLIHPNAVIPIKVGKKPVPDRVIEAVWGFFSVYLFVFVVLLLLVLATGLDQVTAWSAVGATMNNLGPGLGDVSAHYGNIPDTAKWVLCFSMLMGRLEIFTLLILFTPSFWRS